MDSNNIILDQDITPYYLIFSALPFLLSSHFLSLSKFLSEILDFLLTVHYVQPWLQFQ